MAIQLGAMDTRIVLQALREYREALLIGDGDPPSQRVVEKIDSVDRLIKSYRRSYFALERLGRL